MHKNILKAKERIDKFIIETDCKYVPEISQLIGTEVFVKYDNKQRTGSFKYRGSINKLLSLTKEEKKNGVVTMSAGNHAQGVSLGSKQLGIKATIVMPNNTPFEKIRKNIDLGANVIINGNSVNESEKYVNKLVKKHNLTKIHPFDDFEIINGQGTLMYEMLKKVPTLNVVLIPVGGGGLLAGCASIAKYLNKKIKIYGIQSENYPSLYNEYYKKNKPFLSTTIAEGVAVKKIGKKTLPVFKDLIDGVILVKESTIEKAISYFLMKDKTLVEGAGALGLAALMENKKLKRFNKVGIIACGGNLDSRVLSSLLMRDLVRKKQILTLSIDMQDKPGQLNIISQLCAKEKINILGVEHSRFTLDLSIRAARLNITLETQNLLHAQKIVKKIEDQGFRVLEKRTN